LGLDVLKRAEIVDVRPVRPVAERHSGIHRGATSCPTGHSHLCRRLTIQMGRSRVALDGSCGIASVGAVGSRNLDRAVRRLQQWFGR
jgi:hypothetical protein